MVRVSHRLVLLGSFAALGLSSQLEHCEENLREKLDKPNCGLDDPECPLQPPFHSVNISEDGDFRYVQTSYCPPYDWSCLRSPKRRRPCARKATFKLPLRPVIAKEPKQLGLGWPRGGLDHPLKGSTRSDHSFSEMFHQHSIPLDDISPMQGAIGVLVNGVSLNAVACKRSETLEEGSVSPVDSWVDAGDAEKWMDDACAGHLSGGGNYHTHVGSDHTEKQRMECGLPVDKPKSHSELLGWAFDGYGIYGPRDTDGEDPVLDACGGHVDKQRGYHYHLSDTYPYTLECYHGCPEAANNFRFKGVCEPAENQVEPIPPDQEYTEL